jgi:hypothetical protein
MVILYSSLVYCDAYVQNLSTLLHSHETDFALPEDAKFLITCLEVQLRSEIGYYNQQPPFSSRMFQS